ncbi:MAG: hypothetical protein IT201_13660 [Thermoleophilia bacterium]|nr:hypothetical protein [Thermoleophilia bacterium]
MSARAARLVASLDPRRLADERWFAGKGRRIASLSLVDALEAGEGVLALVDVRFAAGPPERYALPAGGPPLWGPLLARLADGDAGRFRLVPCGGAVAPPAGPERPLGRDQSNTSAVLGECLVVKCYRLLWPGPHPEVEVGCHLTRAGFRPCPPVAGSVEWKGEDGPWTVALLQEYVPAAEDGWGRVQAELAAWLAGRRETGWVAELGQLTGVLHAALAAADREALLPRPAAAADRAAWLARARRGLAEAGLGDDAALRERLAVLAEPAGQPLLTRIHGDFHVGQVLGSQAGLHVVDFEGEPTRPPAERRSLDTPLRDVASILRSFDNAARWTLRAGGADGGWAVAARAAFLEAYGPVDAALLEALELEKAVYELVYAARFLPDWMPVARGALASLLGRDR